MISINIEAETPQELQEWLAVLSNAPTHVLNPEPKKPSVVSYKKSTGEESNFTVKKKRKYRRDLEDGFPIAWKAIATALIKKGQPFYNTDIGGAEANASGYVPRLKEWLKTYSITHNGKLIKVHAEIQTDKTKHKVARCWVYYPYTVEDGVVKFACDPPHTPPQIKQAAFRRASTAQEAEKSITY